MKKEFKNENDLERLLNEERDKNKDLIDKKNKLKKKLEESEDKSNKFMKELDIKKKEILNYIIDIQKLKQKIQDKQIIKPEEPEINIYVSSIKYNINNYELKCKKSDLFIHVEEKLYMKYPEMKDKNTYFKLKDNIIKRFRTIEENNIKNNDTLTLDVYVYEF